MMTAPTISSTEWYCDAGHLHCLCVCPLRVNQEMVPGTYFGTAVERLRSVDRVAEHLKLINEGWLNRRELLNELESIETEDRWIPVLHMPRCASVVHNLEVNPAHPEDVRDEYGDVYTFWDFNHFYWRFVR